MPNLLKCYASIEKELTELIRQHFKNISSNNFTESLNDFGYNSIVLCKENLKNEDLDKKTGIYIFEEVSKDSCISEKSWNKFKKDRSLKVPAWSTSGKNDFFYIGKSNNLSHRIDEHTTECSDSTYSLKLYEFCKNHTQTFSYKIHVFYTDSDDSKYRSLNELVEKILHEKLKPCIGSSR